MTLAKWEADRKFISVDENITNQIVGMLDETERKEKLVIWDKFTEYISELFIIPDYVAKRLIRRARVRSTYSINKPNET